MSQDGGEDEIDAIVGAALKAMVESGAGRARLGAFAVSFRDEVAGILGRKPEKPVEPDLLQLVTQAVKQAMADPAIAASRGVAKASARSEPAKRIYVSVAGKPTSVTLSAESYRQLEGAAGGHKQAKAIVQQLAGTAPQDVSNRSGWVQERMLAFAAAEAPGASPRH